MGNGYTRWGIPAPVERPEHTAWERARLDALDSMRRGFENLLVDLAFLFTYSYEATARARVPTRRTLEKMNPLAEENHGIAFWGVVWALATILLLY